MDQPQTEKDEEATAKLTSFHYILAKTIEKKFPVNRFFFADESNWNTEDPVVPTVDEVFSVYKMQRLKIKAANQGDEISYYGEMEKPDKDGKKKTVSRKDRHRKVPHGFGVQISSDAQRVDYTVEMGLFQRGHLSVG